MEAQRAAVRLPEPSCKTKPHSHKLQVLQPRNPTSSMAPRHWPPRAWPAATFGHCHWRPKCVSGDSLTKIHLNLIGFFDISIWISRVLVLKCRNSLFSIRIHDQSCITNSPRVFSTKKPPKAATQVFFSSEHTQEQLGCFHGHCVLIGPLAPRATTTGKKKFFFSLGLACSSPL